MADGNNKFIFYLRIKFFNIMYLRLSQFAGTFYPYSSHELKSMINGFLAQVNVTKIKHQPRALIVPHAGYIYSGIISAYAYKILRGYHYQNIILIGPSHYFDFNGLALAPAGKWQTPLGEIITTGKYIFSKHQDFFTKNILFESTEIHQKEHSLEVQIPFLQIVLNNFMITPILTGHVDSNIAASIINTILTNNQLLIISSDLSHYYSYEEAQKLDKVTIDAILNYDIDVLTNFGEACGKKAIEILLRIAQQNKWQVELLKALNSGDTSGMKDEVVGYGSFVFY